MRKPWSVRRIEQPMLKNRTPDQIYAELFEAVQTSGIFEDSKTFVDATPKGDPTIPRVSGANGPTTVKQLFFDAKSAGSSIWVML